MRHGPNNKEHINYFLRIAILRMGNAAIHVKIGGGGGMVSVMFPSPWQPPVLQFLFTFRGSPNLWNCFFGFFWERRRKQVLAGEELSAMLQSRSHR